MRFHGLSLRVETVRALEQAAGRLTVGAVMAAVLDAWALGRRWRPRPAAAAGLALVAVLAFAGVHCAAPRAPLSPALPEQLVQEDAFSDVAEQGGNPGARRGIPLHPAPWQKAPPCDPDQGEEALNGACYVPVAKRAPPCGPKLLEHAGACYRTVARAAKPPVSVEH